MRAVRVSIAAFAGFALCACAPGEPRVISLQGIAASTSSEKLQGAESEEMNAARIASESEQAADLSRWRAHTRELMDGLRRIAVAEIDTDLLLRLKGIAPRLASETRIEFTAHRLFTGLETPAATLAERQAATGCERSSDARERDAIGFADAKLIKVNRARFACMANDPDGSRRLILRAYADLIHARGTDPGAARDRAVNAILEAMSTLAQPEAGLSVHPVKTCEELLRIGQSPGDFGDDAASFRHRLESAVPTKIWKLQNDIDCSSLAPDRARPRILSQESLDGDGYSIRGLKIRLDPAAPHRTALFGGLCGRCSIRNLSVVDADVQGSALLVAENLGTISHVAISGRLVSESTPRGALAAVNWKGRIERARVEARIEAGEVQRLEPGADPRHELGLTGGAVGANVDGRIKFVRARVRMDVTGAVGGLVGLNETRGLVENSTVDADIRVLVRGPVGAFVAINKGGISRARAHGIVRLRDGRLPVEAPRDVAVGFFAGVNSTSMSARGGSLASNFIRESESVADVCGRPVALSTVMRGREWPVIVSEFVGLGLEVGPRSTLARPSGERILNSIHRGRHLEQCPTAPGDGRSR